jgi:electron transport complex protein RnfC
VQPGSAVTAGLRIAEPADEDGADVYAPLPGRIGAVVEARLVLPRGAVSSPAVEILEAGEAQPFASLGESFDWRSAAAEELRKRLGGGGLVTSRGRIEPLERWAGRARRKRCRVLIANVVESQPFVTADHRLLAEHGAEVIRGLAILAAAVGARKTILAVDGRRIADYRGLELPARDCGVGTIALDPIYPIGNDTILVKVLAGKETPIGGESLDVRAAVTDASACFAAYRWVAFGVPQTGRVVTLAGAAATRSGNYFAPFGMSCAALAGAGGDAWLVHGGPMAGALCGEGAVVSPCTDAILAIEPVGPAVAVPCIRCGWCTDHCPARLNVSALNDLYELGQTDRAERIGAMGCVGCGVCTYICPARLPLSQRVKQLKRMIRNRQAGSAGDGRGADSGRPAGDGGQAT